MERFPDQPRLASPVRWKLGCPGSIHLLYREVAVTQGYPRFIAPMAVLLARWAAGVPVAYFTVSAVLVLIVTLLCELAEDALQLSGLIPRPPLTAGQLAAYGGYARHDPRQGCAVDAGRVVPGEEPAALHGVRPLGFLQGFVNALSTLFFSLLLCELLMGSPFLYGACGHAPMASGANLALGSMLVRLPLACDT